MRRNWVSVTAIAALSLVPGQIAAADDSQTLLPQSIADVVEAARPAFVNVRVKGIVSPAAGQAAFKEPHMTEFVGSGVIVDPTGVIFTNNHVVDNAYELNVTLSDGSIAPARLLGKSRVLDIALIKIDVARPLPVTRVGDSDRVRVGDRVFAMGNPLGLAGTVTSGIVSAVNREVGDTPYNYIQTDAPVNHGNSGGPLFNMRGEVIGINQQIYSGTTGGGSIGLGFAMPVRDLLFLVEQIRDHGRPRFGAIGLLVQSLTPNMAGELQLPDSSGAIVADVVPGSPAEAAGMKIGEVIKSYNDIKIQSHRELIRAIVEYPIGKTVQLGVWSAGTMKTVSMQVREFEQNFWQSYESNTLQEPQFSKISDFGMELSEISPELRKEHSISPKFAGPVVSKVVKEGAADNANFSAGDVMQKVGLAEVKTVADFSRLLTEARDRGARDVLVLVGTASGNRWRTLPLKL